MSFHLSLPVRNLVEMKDFYTRVMQAAVTHDNEDEYINVDLGGAQITLHERPDMPAPSSDIHFGINLPIGEFITLAEHIQRTVADRIKAKPEIVDAGTSKERHKMFLQCPSGYLIELKGVSE